MTKEIRIFLKDEYPGTKIIESSNQKFELIICPNEMVNLFFQDAKIKKTYTNNMSVYLLVGENFGKTHLYIGETNSFSRRIEEHIQTKDKNYNVKKDFQYVVLITTPNNVWDKSDVNFLEKHLIVNAKLNKKLHLFNSKESPHFNLNWKKQELLESVLEEILALLEMLNLNIFKPSSLLENRKNNFNNKRYDKNKLLYLERKNKCFATAFYINGEFIVLKNSWTNLDSFAKYIDKGTINLFDKLITEGILEKKDDKYVFLEDYKFNSPSQAAGLILKQSANGWTQWRNKSNNKVLSDLYDRNKKIIN